MQQSNSDGNVKQPILSCLPKNCYATTIQCQWQLGDREREYLICGLNSVHAPHL